MNHEKFEIYEDLDSFCSAFIRLANDYNDNWFEHNKWFYYPMMIKIFKEYRFVKIKGNEKAKTIAFPSFPEAWSSVDEFHVMDSNLSSMGTTFNVYNGFI